MGLDCLAECSFTGRGELRDARSYQLRTRRPMLCVSFGQAMAKVPASQDL